MYEVQGVCCIANFQVRVGYYRDGETNFHAAEKAGSLTSKLNGHKCENE